MSGKKLQHVFPLCAYIVVVETFFNNRDVWYLKNIYHILNCFLDETYPLCCIELQNTGRFIMSSMITNIYNKKTKGPTLMELFTATGKLKKFS